MSNLKDENSSEDENQSEVDADICSKQEIDTKFSNNSGLLFEEAVSLKKAYILHLASDKQFNRIAAGISDGTVQVFDINSSGLNRTSFNNTPFVKQHSNCGVKFLDDNILCIGTTNGNIDLYDLRTNEKQYTFEDNSNDTKKTITCFDVNSNSRLICAGTDQIMKDAFLLFFDIREKNLIGGYWESHQDDITNIKFHSTNPDLLCSGSTDGLINIFDISKTTEDEALCNTINTENSVHKLNWHKNVYEKDLISCITHTNDLKLYEVEDGDLLSEFNRQNITDSIKRKSVNYCNLINCHNMNDDTTFLLAGTNYNKGETLRSLKIFNKQLIPLANYEDNKQIIRDSLYNEEKNILITSGESGIISLWGPREDTKSTTNLKIKTKIGGKKHGKKPY